ncbi:hypothetical protein [Inconstantimicrobium porci]|nr:hypothetical protein [Inconstantimicrobium porci]
MIKILTDYDTKFKSELLNTLIVYVSCNGEISTTAIITFLFL